MSWMTELCRRIVNEVLTFASFAPMERLYSLKFIENFAYLKAVETPFRIMLGMLAWQFHHFGKRVNHVERFDKAIAQIVFDDVARDVVGVCRSHIFGGI